MTLARADVVLVPQMATEMWAALGQQGRCWPGGWAGGRGRQPGGVSSAHRGLCAAHVWHAGGTLPPLWLPGWVLLPPPTAHNQYAVHLHILSVTNVQDCVSCTCEKHFAMSATNSSLKVICRPVFQKILNFDKVASILITLHTPLMWDQAALTFVTIGPQFMPLLGCLCWPPVLPSMGCLSWYWSDCLVLAPVGRTSILTGLGDRTLAVCSVVSHSLHATLN